MDKTLHVQRNLGRPARPTPPGSRYELPRAKLLGGDPVRGGNPAATGHAGRRTLALASRYAQPGRRRVDPRQLAKAALATVLLIFAQVVGLFACSATPAVAASGTDSKTVTLDGGQSSRHALDGQEAYCCNSYLSSPPIGTVLTNWTSGSLALDYILYHSDGGPSGVSPHYAWWDAKWAVWAVQEKNEFYLTHYANGDTNPNGATVTKLYREARAFESAGGNGPERGCSRIYSPPGGTGYQPIALCVPLVGYIQLDKTSLLPALSAEDACYSLEGATYTVYADATCGTPITTMTTGADGTAKSVALGQGSYWVKETSAPLGFAKDETVYPVQVVASQTVKLNGGDVKDVPLYAPAEALVRKTDAELAARGSFAQAQGDATLSGARFVLERHANATGLTSDAVVRSWVLETDAQGLARLDDEHLVGGDEPYRDADGNAVLPLGTYVMYESVAPEGYLLPEDTTCVFVVTQVGDAAAVRTLQGPTPGTQTSDDARFYVADQVVKGGVRLGKVDAQRGDHTPQGAARLEGATVAIELAGSKPAIVDGTCFWPGSVVTTLTVGTDGCCQTAADALPYGSYVAYELEAPEGYLMTSRGTWSRSFQIREQGAVVDLSSVEDSIPQLVKRGDLQFVKVDGQTMGRLANVAFSLRSLTTGETHVVVTDENGFFSTEAAFNAHSMRTNLNDMALLEDGSVDQEALDPSAGVWFSGGTDTELVPNDLLGALPYDSYRVSELRSAANEGYALLSFDVCVTRDGYVIDCGTLDDQLLPTLQTTLAVAGTSEESDLWSLVDTVWFGNLVADGGSYELRGELHLVGEDGSDLGIVCNPDGNEATAAASFTPLATSGSAQVEFSLDVSALRGQTVVAFEELWRDGELLASHADISDEGQSACIPELATTLSDEHGAKEVDGSGSVTLVDEVRYSGVVPGKTYQVTGILVDKASGEAFVDANGQKVSAQTSFVPETAEGMAWVSFSFDGALCQGKTVVAFEELWQEGVQLAVHADLEDQAQTVTVPRIGTTAMDGADADHELLASAEATIVDTVEYQGLLAGETYELEGTLVDRATGEPLLADGQPVSSHQGFIPEASDGRVQVSFSLDASQLAGTQVTVFETLLRDGRVVASHQDLSSDDQSLSIPRIGTAATSSSGDKTIAAAKEQTIVDQVAFEGLTPGREYLVSGVLHLRGADGSDEGPLTDAEGKPVSASARLVPEESSGTTELSFTFDASRLADRDVVAFELLMTAEGESAVASHEDISDGGQTVHVEKPAEPDKPSSPPTTPSKTTSKQALPKTGDLAMPLKGLSVSAVLSLALGAWMRRRGAE